MNQCQVHEGERGLKIRKDLRKSFMYGPLVPCPLFAEHPGIEPGRLTNLRSALVNNNTLARISVETRLYTHLLYNSPR